MKRLVNLLAILLVLYFGIELSFINLNHGHTLEYKIKNDKHLFNIKEIYTKKRKGEIDNYYFEIKINDYIFNYQTYKNYKRANYIIKDINYFEDQDYKCIYLKDKNNKAVADVICLNDGIQYYYNNIKGKNKELDRFVSTLKGYSFNKDNIKDKIDASPVTLYTSNLIDNHYISLQNYKGLYLINKKDKIRNITLFNNDIYTNRNSITSNKFYITADYNKEYKFHEFYLVNIKNGKKNKIISNDDISLESYMQGCIDSEVFFFDKADKKQYRINLKNKTVTLVGNTSKGITLYRDNKFVDGSAYDAAKYDITFNKYTIDNEFSNKEYSKVDKVGNKLSGYYYLYLKNNNYYKVYKVNVQNKNIFTFLFNTDDIENIYYYKDYIYYKDGLYIRYYQNDIGIKTLLKNDEFEFNKSIKFGLYVD